VRIICGRAHAPVSSGAMEKIRIEQHSFTGGVWVLGWLFAVGFLQLSFWKAVLGLLLWPYYLGVALRSLPH
jgi:uncharacterized membrane protein